MFEKNYKNQNGYKIDSSTLETEISFFILFNYKGPVV